MGFISWLRWLRITLIQDSAIRRIAREKPRYRRLTAEELAGMARPLPGEPDELPGDDHLCVDCRKPLDNVRDDMCDNCGEIRLRKHEEERIRREGQPCKECGKPVGRIRLLRESHCDPVCDGCWETRSAG